MPEADVNWHAKMAEAWGLFAQLRGCHISPVSFGQDLPPIRRASATCSATLYLKADALSARDFAAEGKGPFTYRPKGRVPLAMSYWEVPERLLDDPEELVTWARRAHAVALTAKGQ